MNRNLIAIGPLVLDPVTQREALHVVHELIEAREGGFVVTPNVDHMVMAHRDVVIRQIYRRARLSLADGQPLVWMARALRTPVPEKVSGSDLIEPLMAYAASTSRGVFFFGARPEVSAEAERRLVARHPRLRIVGRDCSDWSPDDPTTPGESRVARAIRDSGADLVVVALGSPKQEHWMSRHEREIAPAVALGLGGSLDFVAGAVPRAPAWMSRAGLEWLFRLGQDPRRMAYRYLVRDLHILPILAGEVASRARRRAYPNPLADSEVGSMSQANPLDGSNPL